MHIYFHVYPCSKCWIWDSAERIGHIWAGSRAFPPSLTFPWCFPGNVQAGPSPGDRSHQSDHPEIQEHPLCHHKARRVQEPSVRHLHRLWRGQGEPTLAPAGQGSFLSPVHCVPPARECASTAQDWPHCSSPSLPSCRSKTCPSRLSWQLLKSSKCKENLFPTSRKTHRPPRCRRRARKRR